jgi:hypothetical protein
LEKAEEKNYYKKKNRIEWNGNKIKEENYREKERAKERTTN